MSNDISEKLTQEVRQSDTDIDAVFGGIDIDLDDLDALDALDELLSGPDDRAVTEATRPALEKLTRDIRALERELLDGFQSRRDVLDWLQRLTIRTLGELPIRWYAGMAKEFRGPDSGNEHTLLSAMLSDAHRTRDLDSDVALGLRQLLIAFPIHSAYNDAFWMLRKDAGEYADADSDKRSQHAARYQKHPVMRPSLSELEHYQKKALNSCLDGFDHRLSILNWTEDVTLASNGALPKALAAKMFGQSSMVAVLMGGGDSYERARELVVATYLLPLFCYGVRDLSGRTTELPDPDRPESEVHFA